MHPLSENGFMIHHLWRQFNRDACTPPEERKNPTSKSPLAAIEYRPPLRNNPSILSEIAETMVETTWFQTYGLNFLDTLQLTGEEFNVLKNRVPIRTPPKPPENQ